MDPKLSNLDPKLQAAYNRVMAGPNANPTPQQPNQPVQNPNTQQVPAPQQQPISNTPVPPPSEPAPELNQANQFPTNAPINNPTYTNQNPAPTPPAPENFNLNAQPSTPTNTNPNNPIPPSNTPTPVMPSSSSTVAFNAENSSKNIGTTPVKKTGAHHILPIIVGLGIIVLLAAYTFIWIMIFNVEVPFLPKF